VQAAYYFSHEEAVLATCGVLIDKPRYSAPAVPRPLRAVPSYRPTTAGTRSVPEQQMCILALKGSDGRCLITVPMFCYRS
jgi:hypothetical protein